MANVENGQGVTLFSVIPSNSDDPILLKRIIGELRVCYANQ